MHWLAASSVNNKHDGVSVAYPTADILFLFRGKRRHSNVCYNMAMVGETSDVPSWLGREGVTGGACLVPLHGGAGSTQTREGGGSGWIVGWLVEDSSTVRGEARCEGARVP
jgi:hypothetical protein